MLFILSNLCRIYLHWFSLFAALLRKDKSLGIMSQKFLMLFLVSTVSAFFKNIWYCSLTRLLKWQWHSRCALYLSFLHCFQPRVVNLDLAAKILIGDPNIDRTENAKFKSKAFTQRSIMKCFIKHFFVCFFLYKWM